MRGRRSGGLRAARACVLLEIGLVTIPGPGSTFNAPDRVLAWAEWRDLQRIFPGPEIRQDGPAPFFAAPHLAAYSLDSRHPSSLLYSLRKARENARAVREALTVEVFVGLNGTWRGLEAYTGARRPRCSDVP